VKGTIIGGIKGKVTLGVSDVREMVNAGINILHLRKKLVRN